VTQLGLGGASSGSLWHQVPEFDAIETIEAAWDAGSRYFDTSPWYGRGLSGLHTGAGLAEHVERNAAAFRHPITADLHTELMHEGLLREDAPVPT